jgi:hypothetical protein
MLRPRAAHEDAYCQCLLRKLYSLILIKASFAILCPQPLAIESELRKAASARSARNLALQRRARREPWRTTGNLGQKSPDKAMVLSMCVSLKESPMRVLLMLRKCPVPGVRLALGGGGCLMSTAATGGAPQSQPINDQGTVWFPLIGQLPPRPCRSCSPFLAAGCQGTPHQFCSRTFNAMMACDDPRGLASIRDNHCPQGQTCPECATGRHCPLIQPWEPARYVRSNSGSR